MGFVRKNLRDVKSLVDARTVVQGSPVSGCNEAMYLSRNKLSGVGKCRCNAASGT
jgi:hypothetical protein